MKLSTFTIQLTVLLVSLLGYTQHVQKTVLNSNINRGFSIYGQLKGIKDGTWLYLILNKEEGGTDTVAKVKSDKERFRFNGYLSKEGDVGFIKIDTTKTKYSESIRGYITIFIENRDIRLLGSIKDFGINAVKVSGSKTHEDFLDYQNRSMPIKDTIKKLRADLNKMVSLSGSQEAIKTKLRSADSMTKVLSTFRKNWIMQHLSSMFTPWLIPRTFGKDVDSLEFYFNLLYPMAKKSTYGVKLHQQINLIRNTSIGSLLPNSNLPNVVGDTISIYSEIMKGELTLIDFWASWCKPCRQSFPELKDLYVKYNSRGFNIIGISTDHKPEEWKKALKVDQLPWNNVVCARKSIVNNLYGVTAIPASFLVDKEGKIIAKWVGENKELEKLINKELEK